MKLLEENGELFQDIEMNKHFILLYHNRIFFSHKRLNSYYSQQCGWNWTSLCEVKYLIEILHVLSYMESKVVVF